MSSATVPPTSFTGATGGGVTGSYRQPPSSQPTVNPTQSQINNSRMNSQDQLVDADGNVLVDQSSLFMFTTVGYVGLHFVVRPLFRWGIRSLLLPAKLYDSGNNATKKSSKSKSKSKSKLTKSKSDSDANTEENSEIVVGSESDLLSKKKKKRLLLADASSGVCSPYGEILTTFGALTFISTLADPRNVLLYFGMFYPSYPYILRAVETINGPKSKMTASRASRLAGKAIITTGGFALSMMVGGFYLQTVPFLNVVGLTFWDCVADYVLSDGPDR